MGGARAHCGVVLAWLAAAGCAAAERPDVERHMRTLRPLLERYCIDCHAGDRAKGELDLARYRDAASMQREARHWREVIAAVERGDMPPQRKLQPGADERRALLQAIAAILDEGVRRNAGDPGRVVMRRLTVDEYDATLRDLTGVEHGLGASLPADEPGGEGFTNAGATQGMSPIVLERYLAAGRQVAERVAFGPRTGLHFAGAGAAVAAWRAELMDALAPHAVDLAKARVPVYIRACWERAHGGRPPAEPAAARGIERKILERWWAFLHAPSEALGVRQLQQQFRLLPRPLGGGAAPPELAVALREFEWSVKQHGFTTLQHLDLAYRMPRFTDVVDIWPETREISIVLTDCGDGNAEDVVNLELVYATEPIAHRHGTHWLDRFPRSPGTGQPVPLQPYRDWLAGRAASGDAACLGALARFGKDMQGRPLDGAGWLRVQAPCVVTLPVPPGARAMVLRTPDGTARDTIAFKPGRAPTMQIGIVRGDGAHVAGTWIPGMPVYTDRLNDIQAQLRIRHARPVMDALTVDIPDRRNHDGGAGRAFWTVQQIDQLMTGTYRNIYALDDEDVVAACGRAQGEALLAKARDMGFFERSQSSAAKGEVAAAAGAPRAAAVATADPATRIAVDLALLRARLPDDIVGFAARCWRRPLRVDEDRRLRASFAQMLALADGPDPDPRPAARAMLGALLASPDFLYRVERAGDGISPVGDSELASRLSYFLWGSMPDEPLMADARAGRLRDDPVLDAQARRMLRDPRARSLATAFFGQWLGFYGFDRHASVDTGRFPEFTPALRASMQEESIRFCLDLIQQDRSILDLVDGPRAFVDLPLARLYGIRLDGKQGEGGHVAVDGPRAANGRIGIITNASLLTLTSQPLRTSPVKRGHWLYEVLLGQHTPPPPADVAPLPEDDAPVAGLSIRAMLEKHRSQPDCAGCHVRIDPYGISLEHFDPIGRRRERDGSGPIDARATVGAATFAGIDGLRGHLRARADDIRRTAFTKLLGYALGRGVEDTDRPLVDAALERMRSDDRFSVMALAIVQSRQFRNRSNAAPPSPDGADRGSTP